MKLTIEPASAETFAAMATWRYEAPYDFYDGDQEPVLNPERFFAAVGDDGTLVGFYYFENKGDVLEIGLGLRPDLTGRALGGEFFRHGLDFARSYFQPTQIVLNVAAFNEPNSPWFQMFSQAVYKGDIAGALKTGQSGFERAIKQAGDG